MSDVENEVLDDDKILNENQKIRKEIITTITKYGIPEDKDSQYVLLTTLKDMDKQVVDKKRLSIDDKNSNIALTVAKAVNTITELFEHEDPFKRQSNGVVPILDKEKVPEYTPALGEMEQGISNETYENFMSIHGKK